MPAATTEPLLGQSVWGFLDGVVLGRFLKGAFMSLGLYPPMMVPAVLAVHRARLLVGPRFAGSGRAAPGAGQRPRRRRVSFVAAMP